MWMVVNDDTLPLIAIGLKTDRKSLKNSNIPPYKTSEYFDGIEKYTTNKSDNQMRKSIVD